MSVFFSSDWHLNHANIAGAECSSWGGGYRTFKSKEEMTEVIIAAVNKTVGINDTLYYLGDFCFGDHTLTPKWRDRILCKNIIFIKGNHDNNIRKYRDSFPSISDYLRTKVEGQSIVFSHYPIMSWENMSRGSWMIHGHCHAHDDVDALNELCKRFDCGIDSAYKIFGEYRPFSFTEIKEIMDAKPIGIVDHHKTTR